MRTLRVALRRCSLRTYGSAVHLPRLRARLSALRVRLRRMFPSKQSFFGASLASRIHAFNASARPSAIPSAYWPRPSKASLFRRLPSAFLTAIKSASFPMALLHDFLDRHPLRRKQQYYTIILRDMHRRTRRTEMADPSPPHVHAVLHPLLFRPARNQPRGAPVLLRTRKNRPFYGTLWLQAT